MASIPIARPSASGTIDAGPVVGGAGSLSGGTIEAVWVVILNVLAVRTLQRASRVSHKRERCAKCRAIKGEANTFHSVAGSVYYFCHFASRSASQRASVAQSMSC